MDFNRLKIMVKNRNKNGNLKSEPLYKKKFTRKVCIINFL